MASQATPSAHVVGNMFVEQYYPILRHQPEELHKFYLDSSVLSRPDVNGVMTSVTTMKAIDEKVMSLDYKSYTVEIKTVDAQHSYKDGVIVLVTGCFIGKDNLRQKFTQSFFLAPQENGGYFVLNDVFRFVEDIPPEELNGTPANDADDATPVASLSTEPDSDPAYDPPPLPIKSEEQNTADEPHESSTEIECTSAEEVIDAAVAPSTTTFLPAPDAVTVVVQEDAPKKSYASIVKVMKGSFTSSPASNVKAQTTVTKPQVPSMITEKQSAAPSPAAAPPSEVPVTDINNAFESSSPLEDVEGYSIYLRNLPLNATPSQLEGEFKKFGPIKPGGIQVRNHKQNGYCFGFVEFESMSSMRSAIEASPIMVAGRPAVVEEKRTTTRVTGGSNSTGGRGRFAPLRGGFRNDSFRGRGGYGGGQGYGRSEFRSRGEFSSRGRGAAGRTESYQRVGRPNVVQAAVSAA